MPSRVTRREFFLSSLALRGAFAAAGPRFEGIFPIMQTPFTASGALDTAALIGEVRFLHRLGVQGMVWPQLASEYASLELEERLQGAAAVVQANKALDAATRPAIVIGVQGPDVAAAVRYARHAQKLAPDGIIAIPLDGGKGESRQIEYYSAIAEACSLPLFVQTIGDMSVDLVLRMAGQIPTLRYVKDEAGVTLPRITDYRARGRDLVQSVFTGAHGRNLLDELARGAAGTMPAAGFADLYVAAWRAWKSGRRDQAMETFARTLLLIADAQAYGIQGLKYVLELRGVFPNSRCRAAGQGVFDAEARQAIRETVAYLRKWFKS
jgi:4-hydroxy-tetrahydrodipicolinate synthase